MKAILDIGSFITANYSPGNNEWQSLIN